MSNTRQWLNERVDVRRYLAESVSIPRWLWLGIIVALIARSMADLLRWLIA